MKKIQLMALFSLVALLAGCGGGSSTTASVPTATTASVSGTVADGYLVGATVFLDKNRDFVLDTASEPYALTDANGAYTLMVDAADIGKYPVVALATTGVTKDTDSNDYVAESYLLCLPAASMVRTDSGVSGTVDTNFISPISTLVQERMAADPTLTLAQAVEQVRTELGLMVGANPLGNYLQGPHANTQLHTMAREMVALMMEQRAQIMNTDGTHVDPTQYRAMVRTMNSQMTGMMQNAADAAGLQSTFMNTMRNRIMSAFGKQ